MSRNRQWCSLRTDDSTKLVYSGATTRDMVTQSAGTRQISLMSYTRRSAPMGHKLKQAYAKAVTFNLLSIKYHNVQYSVTPDGKIMLNEGASRSEMIVGIVSPQRPRPRRAIWLGF